MTFVSGSDEEFVLPFLDELLVGLGDEQEAIEAYANPFGFLRSIEEFEDVNHVLSYAVNESNTQAGLQIPRFQEMFEDLNSTQEATSGPPLSSSPEEYQNVNNILEATTTPPISNFAEQDLDWTQILESDTLPIFDQHNHEGDDDRKRLRYTNSATRQDPSRDLPGSNPEPNPERYRKKRRSALQQHLEKADEEYILKVEPRERKNRGVPPSHLVRDEVCMNSIRARHSVERKDTDRTDKAKVRMRQESEYDASQKLNDEAWYRILESSSSECDRQRIQDINKVLDQIHINLNHMRSVCVMCRGNCHLGGGDGDGEEANNIIGADAVSIPFTLATEEGRKLFGRVRECALPHPYYRNMIIAQYYDEFMGQFDVSKLHPSLSYFKGCMLAHEGIVGLTQTTESFGSGGILSTQEHSVPSNIVEGAIPENFLPHENVAPLQFIFCRECLSDIQGKQKRCKGGLSNLFAFGDLPHDLYAMLNDGIEAALKSYFPFFVVKTWRGDSNAQRLIGHYSVVDLGASLAGVFEKNRELLAQFRTMKVLLVNSLSEPQRKQIREFSKFNMHDLLKVHEYVSARNPYCAKAADMMERLRFGIEVDDRSGWINPCVEVDFGSRANGMSSTYASSHIGDYENEDFKTIMTPVFHEIEGDEEIAIAEKLGLQAGLAGVVKMATGLQFQGLQQRGAFAKAFPTMFPYGVTPMDHDKREPRCGKAYSIRKFLQQRRRRGKGFNFELLCALSSTIRILNLARMVHVRVENAPPSVREQLLNVSPVLVANHLAQLHFGSGNNPKSTELIKMAIQCIEHALTEARSRKYMRGVLYSNSFHHGPANALITLSPTERNPYLYRYCITGRSPSTSGDVEFSIPTPSDIPTPEQCVEAHQNNPVEANAFFVRFLDVFIELYLGWDRKNGRSYPGGGVLGEIVWFAGLPETNARMYHHIHMLLRFKGGTCGRSDFRERLIQQGKAFSEKITFFYDSIMQSEIEMEFVQCPQCQKRIKIDWVKPTPKGHGHQDAVNVTPVNYECECGSRNTALDLIITTLLTRLRQATPPENVKAFSYQHLEYVVRQFMFTFTIARRNEPSYRSYALAVLVYFNYHFFTHHATCFKTGGKARIRAACRFHFPRPVVEKTHIDEEMNVQLKRNVLSEWLNAAPVGSCETFFCNTDLQIVESGNELDNSIVYITGYATKSTDKATPEEKKMVDRAIVTKHVHQQIENLNNYFTEEESVAQAKRSMLGICMKMLSADPLDGVQLAWSCTQPSIAVLSHPYKTVGIYELLKHLEGDTKTDILLRQDIDGQFKPILSGLQMYLNRPACDEYLCLLVFTATRKQVRGRAFDPRSMFSRNRMGNVRCVPTNSVPNVVPPRPHLANKLSPGTRKFILHSREGCTCRRELPAMACLKRTGFMANAKEPVPSDIHESRDAFGTEELIEEELYWTLSHLYEDPEYEYATNDIVEDGEPGTFTKCTPDGIVGETDLQYSWGLWTLAVMSPLRMGSTWKICENETVWDCANRLLYEYMELAREDDATTNIDKKLIIQARIILNWHLNHNELQKSAEDHCLRRTKDQVYEDEVKESLTNELKVNLSTPRENDDSPLASDEDVHDLFNILFHATEMANYENENIIPDWFSSASEVADSLLNKHSSLQRMALEASRPRVFRNFTGHSILLGNTENAKSSEDDQTIRDFQRLVPGPHVRISVDTTLRDSILDVSRKFKLRDKQLFAFIVISARLLAELKPDMAEPTFQGIVFPPRFRNTDMRMILTGLGGCGKSTCVRALLYLASIWGCEGSVVVVSFQGIAAVNCNGVTIHSAAGLSINSKRVARKSNYLTKNVKLLIVDEYAQVGKKLFLQLANSCRKFCDSGRCADFGIPLVILTGDHVQLRPINDFGLFDPIHYGASIDNIEIQRSAAELFRQFTKNVISLTKNWRGEDESYASFVALLRQPDAFASQEHLQAMCNQINARFRQPVDSENEYPLILVSTNKQRKDASRYFLRRLRETRGIEMFKIFQVNPKSDMDLQRLKIVEEYMWETGSKCTVHSILYLYVGMPISITRNTKKFQSAGISNQAPGVITGIKWPDGVNFQFDEQEKCWIPDVPPSYLVVRFFHLKESVPFMQGFHPNERPIEPISCSGTTEFKQYEKKRLPMRVRYSLRGFPIRYRFASTFHASQCLGLRGIIFTNPFDAPCVDRERFLYLAMSRGSEWKNFSTLVPFTPELLKRFKPSDHDHEVELNNEKVSRELLKDFKVNLELLELNL